MAFAPVTDEAVRAQLRTVFDPEIPANIVDLGLIYGIQVSPDPAGGSRVLVKMTLTAPGCTMSQFLVDDVLAKAQSVPGVSGAEVEVVFDPPWTPEAMSEAARLATGMF